MMFVMLLSYYCYYVVSFIVYCFVCVIDSGQRLRNGAEGLPLRRELRRELSGDGAVVVVLLLG